MTASIVATGLTRSFGSLTAVDAVDLDIAEGTLYGFLGRNGAGKTTLIRMLLGLIRPTAGQVSILGQAVDSRGGPSGPWADVGYLLDAPGLYPELSVRDHLRLVATYRRVPPSACDEAARRLDLGRYLDVRADALSHGNQRRLGLAMALAAGTALGMPTAAVLTLLAITPIAYVASRTRGDLAPLGSTVGLVAVAQVAAILGWGAYVPWAIPALAAGVAPDQSATPLSWLIVVATGLLGLWATVRWWRGPDAGL